MTIRTTSMTTNGQQTSSADLVSSIKLSIDNEMVDDNVDPRGAVDIRANSDNQEAKD